MSNGFIIIPSELLRKEYHEKDVTPDERQWEFMAMVTLQQYYIHIHRSYQAAPRYMLKLFGYPESALNKTKATNAFKRLIDRSIINKIDDEPVKYTQSNLYTLEQYPAFTKVDNGCIDGLYRLFTSGEIDRTAFASSVKVYSSIASRIGNVTKVAYPSRETIAKDTNLSNTTIGTALSILTSNGFLLIARTPTVCKGNIINSNCIYAMNDPEGSRALEQAVKYRKQMVSKYQCDKDEVLSIANTIRPISTEQVDSEPQPIASNTPDFSDNPFGAE